MNNDKPKRRASSVNGANRIEPASRATQFPPPNENTATVWPPEVDEIISAAPAVIFLAHDSECRRITGSHAAYELLRRPRGTILFENAPATEPPPRFTSVRENRVLALEELPMQQAARGIEIRGMELSVAFGDGTTKHIYGGATPLLDSGGRPQGALAAFVEVTELKRTQAALALEIRELTRSNAELEQFALHLAHDLKSPLLSLSGCSQILVDENQSLSDSAREMVGYIQDSVRHMDRMIASLLHYSRLGMGQLKKAFCPLEKVLGDVLSHLRTALSKAGAQVTHDALPDVQADSILLDNLFQNLIENSIKYRSEASPRVHISSRREAGEWVFAVRDNGLGIDARYSEQIFQLFRRLHPDESTYDGLGVGLAVCKKIVERHGGRIWVESSPHRGATFFFTLPSALEVKP